MHSNGRYSNALCRVCLALLFAFAAFFSFAVGIQAATCDVVGGASASSPVNLGATFSNTTCDTFVLGNGYYTAATINRAGITVRAANKCQVQVAPGLHVYASNVTVDGLSITGNATGIDVSKPGVKILNSYIQQFGKTGYANGIWVYKEALDPQNHVVIEGNTLNNWGGVQYAGGIAIGKAADSQTITGVSVEVRNNRVTNGPTASGLYSAAIQSFHPFIAIGNYVHTVSGTSMQNKTFNSTVSCNEFVNIIGDGALYNRANSNNTWEYNIVHDSDFGIDHFVGDNVIYRGNVIYNVNHLGRIKNQGVGSHSISIENNTFYNSSGWAGWIWDVTSGGTLGNITWKKNIFDRVNGAAISSDSRAAGSWSETENIFYKTAKPGGSRSLTSDPQFVSPGSNFSAQAPSAAGKGAPWPLPCGSSPTDTQAPTVP